MAQLTVKEKEHWKERISRKVDQAIDGLLLSHDSRYLERLEDKAHQMALESLGIQKLEQELLELERQEVHCRNRRQYVFKQMVTQVTGCAAEHQSRTYFSKPHEVEQAVAKRRQRHEEELLGKDELGRQILALRREKDELLDTVWLATTCQTYYLRCYVFLLVSEGVGRAVTAGLSRIDIKCSPFCHAAYSLSSIETRVARAHRFNLLYRGSRCLGVVRSSG